MFCVQLRFSHNKSQAARHMAEHTRWVQQGFDEGVFLVAGSLVDQQGGMVIAHNTTHDALSARLARDPFVAAEVVTAEITPMVPNRVDARLQFLMDHA